MAKNGQNRQIVIFLETMDPGGAFGMVIARIGRVVIFWQVSEVGGQPAILAKGPVRGVLGSRGGPPGIKSIISALRRPISAMTIPNDSLWSIVSGKIKKISKTPFLAIFHYGD